MRLVLRILLILTVLLLAGFWISKRLSRRSTGIYVRLPADSRELGCVDLVLTIQQHSLKINYDSVPFESLAARLKGIYGIRYKHVLLVRAYPDVSFQEVIDVLDVAQRAVSDMELVLLTPKAEKTASCILTDGLKKMD
jgi:biopolymer transport protein ExbD